MCQAELKDCKFGETLTSNVDGNPEPSCEVTEGVETRHSLCVKCGKQIPLDKNSNARFCSDRCRNNYNSLKWRIKKGYIKNPGVGSGGNQLGITNHQYKTGIGTFRQRALKEYGSKCNRCESEENICVHHRDEDRTNNSLKNLEVLCKKCHQEHHIQRDLLGRYSTHIKG